MADFENPDYEFVEQTKRARELVEEKFKDAKTVAVDVESSGLDPYLDELLLVQIGLPEKAYIFDARQVDLSVLKDFLEAKHPLKILQNGKFDYKFLKICADIELHNVYDTYLAERLLTCGERDVSRSLGALAEKYLDLELDKDWESYNWELAARSGDFTEMQLVYSALDVLVLFPIFKKTFRSLKKEKMIKVAKLEFACLPVVAEVEIHGINIDKEKWENLIAELKVKRNEIAAEIQAELRPLYKTQRKDLFGNHVDVVNLNSPAQVVDAFSRVGVDIPSTGVSILREIEHPLAEMMLEYRGYEKLISAFGDNFIKHIHPKTGRLHSSYMQIGADTGRFACSKPNLQQVPSEEEFRSCFNAPEGRKMVTADYSQVELRILAEMSEDPTLIKAFRAGKDLHTFTASQMFEIPEEEVHHDVERFQAKSINFGLMYGRGVHSLANQLEVSVDHAKNLLNKYFDRYSKVQDWLEKVARDAVKNGYSTTPIGRKRVHSAPDPDDPNRERAIASIERKGKNTPIQGASADMIKYALVYVWKSLKEENLDAFPVHTVHDEIVLEANEEQAERVKTVLEEEMKRAGELILTKVPVKVDAIISDIWEH
ncbi:MAG: DNA polymerase [Patescibacteria group bacterium]